MARLALTLLLTLTWPLTGQSSLLADSRGILSKLTPRIPFQALKVMVEEGGENLRGLAARGAFEEAGGFEKAWKAVRRDSFCAENTTSPRGVIGNTELVLISGKLFSEKGGGEASSSSTCLRRKISESFYGRSMMLGRVRKKWGK